MKACSAAYNDYQEMHLLPRNPQAGITNPLVKHLKARIGGQQYLLI